MYYKTQWAWQGVQLCNPIDVNFHLQKSLEIFAENSADQIQSKKYKGIKVPSLMPIRVKHSFAVHNVP